MYDYVRGRKIAQIYVTDQLSSLPRPIRELKGFIKVDFKPGTTKMVEQVLDREPPLGFYDDRAAHWIAERGKYIDLIAASSADIRLTRKIELAEDITWNGPLATQSFRIWRDNAKYTRKFEA